MTPRKAFALDRLTPTRRGSRKFFLLFLEGRGFEPLTANFFLCTNPVLNATYLIIIKSLPNN